MDYTGETDIAVCEGFMNKINTPIRYEAMTQDFLDASECTIPVEDIIDALNTATAREARLVEALESTANASRQTLDIIKRERFVFDDLTDRWQKLAFTIYTELTQASTDAKNALAEHRGEKANTEEKDDDG
mgnify:CR=1 FL=1